MYESRLSTLSSFNTEQVRLVERIHLDFVRAGAKFDAAAQEKYSTIIQNLAVLTTKFTQVSSSIYLYHTANSMLNVAYSNKFGHFKC